MNIKLNKFHLLKDAIKVRFNYSDTRLRQIWKKISIKLNKELKKIV